MPGLPITGMAHIIVNTVAFYSEINFPYKSTLWRSGKKKVMPIKWFTGKLEYLVKHGGISIHL